MEDSGRRIAPRVVAPGIAGLWYVDGQPLDDGVVRRLAEGLRVAVPAVPPWEAREAGRRAGGPLQLHVAGVPAAWQPPVESPEGALVVVADARIDNRAELVRRLGLPAAGPEPPSDAGLILAAYAAWGTGCPEALVGDFAFALWDARRAWLFCARDPMGVRPFYYTSRPGFHFAYASAADALRQVDPSLYAVDEAMVGLFLAGRHAYERERTFFQGLRRLPAGHAMVVRRDGVSIRAYWRPDAGAPPAAAPDEAGVEAFGEVLREAVRCRLGGGERVGSMMSGGLDSTAVACVARDLLAPEGRLPLPTLTVIFPGLPEALQPRIDERPFVDAALHTGGFEPVWIRGDVASPLEHVGALLERTGQPHDVFGAYLSLEAFAAAQSAGVRALLDGIDGDTAVSHGLDYLDVLLREGRLDAFVREGTAFCRRWGRPPAPFLRSRVRAFLKEAGEDRPGDAVRQVRRLARVAGDAPARLLLHVLAGALPAPLQRLGRRLRGREAAGTGPLLHPAFARRIALGDLLAAQPEGARPASFREAHARQLTSGVWQTGLEVTGALGASFGVEPRHPFFDRRLLELSLSLAPDLKLRDGWTRYVLRAALGSVLPDAIRWRVGKADLGVNFNHRLFTADRRAVEAALWQDAAWIEPFCDVAALRRSFARFVAVPHEASTEAMHLYLAAVLSRWLQQVDRQP